MSITASLRSRALLALGAAALLGACNDSPTIAHPNAVDHSTAAGNGADTRLEALQCSIQVALRTVSCQPSLPAGAASRDVILGGQNQYVKLTSSNVSRVGSVFSFDVTVQNLIPQPLATTDGTTSTATGVRVFFASGPTVTGGTGNVDVANPDGITTFTAANQPFFAYSNTDLGPDGILSPNETSGAKNWQLNIDPTVTSVSFLVYVSTAVPHPRGFVQLSLDSGFVSAGSSQTLTASVRTFVGGSTSGAPAVTWASNNTNVATVSSSGQVTGVAPGVVTISATSDTLVGRATIRICPNMSTVGSSYVITTDTASIVCVAGASSAAAEYVAVPYNTPPTGALPYTFTGIGIQAVTGPPTPDVAPAAFRQALASMAAASARTLPPGGYALSPLQGKMRQGIPALTSLASLTSVSRGASVARTTRFASGRVSHDLIPSTVPAVGDTMRLDVQLICANASDNRPGVVRSVSSRAIVVSDTSNPVGGFTTAQFDSIAQEFDTITYVVDSTNFGAPTDHDGNGRTVLFFTNAVNALAQPSSSDFYGGIFAPKDLVPQTTCATSNFGEVLYLAVPDPTGIYGAARSTSAVRATVTPYMTHHFEHLINGWRRAFVTGASALEEPFLDEALADEATELAFFRTSAGLAPRTNISATDITTGPNAAQRTAAFNTYQRPNFVRLGQWMQQPDTTTDPKTEPSRGMYWAFLRYAADRANKPTDAEFWRTLVNSNLQGIANINNAIGTNTYLWLRDFAAAVYADDAVPGVAAIYTMPTWNLRSIYTSLLGGFPLVVHPLTNNSPLAITLGSGGSSYLRFAVPAAGFGQLVTGANGGTPPSTFGMTIIRTK